MDHFITRGPASMLMRSSARIALCWALLAAGTAQAQTTVPAADPAADTAQNATSGSAAGQPTTAGPAERGQLEDIVVTAQFRSQALQDTPLAITAMSGDMLTQRNITTFADVGATAPSVSLRPAAGAFGKATTAYIRGVGQGDYNYAYEPAVGIYIDDVYYSTLYGSTFDLLDLDRVEILRGPQGTLFGKNSIGGAVRLISRAPKGDNSGFVEATYGSYDRLDLRGAFDLGITDNLAMRVSAVSKTRKGYVRLVDFTCERPAEAGTIPSTLGGPNFSGKNCNIGRLGGDDTQAARVAFRWTPSPALEINLTGDYMKDNSEATANTLIAADPNTVRFAAWNNQVNIPQFGVPFDSRFVPDDPYKSYATFVDPSNGTVSPRTSPIESWGTSLTVDYQLATDLSLKSITGYRKYNAVFSYDQDNSPLQYQNVLSDLSHRQFSQELRLTGKTFSDMLDFTVGGFYFDSHSTLDGPVQINGTTTSFVQNDRFDTTNESAFVHLSFRPVEPLEFVGGLRYTHEKKSNLFNHVGQLSVPLVEQSYSRWDWRGGINYHLNDDMMLYGQVSTGYRSGGFNPRPFSAAQLVSFGPESLTAYEVGAKTELFDRRLRFNVAGYISKYKDRLINIQSVDADGLPFSRPSNLGTATIKGIELEAEARPVEGLTFNASAGYTHFASPDLPGLKAAAIPDWTASAGVQYAGDIPDIGTLTPRLDWIYQSKVYFDNTNAEESATPARSIFNARLGFVPEGSDWSIALSVTNLFDKFYYISKFYKIPLGQGTIEGQPARPREWAITIRRDF